MNKKCFGRVLAWLLLAAMCLPAPSFAAASASVVERAFQIISKMETGTNYTLAGNDTNGRPSVGVLQWNGSRAVSLLQAIIADDPAGAKTLMGSALYKELNGASASVWNRRTLSKSERTLLGKLLGSRQGIARQKELAQKDITRYIETAMALGITDPNALCYYADIAHQTGVGKKYAEYAKGLAGSYRAITLDILYKAALHYATFTKSRRTRVYNMLKEDPIPVKTPSADPDAGAKPKKITLGKTGTIKLKVGQSKSLTAKVSPLNADPSVTWTSSKPAVAAVSESGEITALAPGKTVITAKTVNGKKASVRVKVARVRVTGVTIQGSSSMRKGKTQQLRWEILPANATNTGLKWKSSDRKVLRVNAKGQVKAYRKGRAVISCKTVDGSEIRAKFVITVN